MPNRFLGIKIIFLKIVSCERIVYASIDLIISPQTIKTCLNYPHHIVPPYSVFINIYAHGKLLPINTFPLATVKSEGT